MSLPLNQARVSIENVSHSYQKGVKALDGINLDIGPGLFGLLGANGAGKSTLMRILATLQIPSEGRVLVAGHDLMSNRFAARKQIGYLPQTFGAWPTYSVEQALDLLASFSGLDDAVQRKKRVAATLEALGLSAVAKRKVKQLSGGMVRRLGIAQAMIHDPAVLILDEPTVGLDPQERLRFRQLIAQQSRERVVILSTHIIADLGSSCSHLALIYQGQMEYQGEPSVLIAEAKGKVVEVSCSPEELTRLDADHNFEVVGRKFEGERSILRGVCKPGTQLENAIEADNISLEEAYIAFNLSKGRKGL